MITNTFHKDNNLIGLNIERDLNSFTMCIAYFINDKKWTAKTLSGIYGDLNDEDLIKKIMTNGQFLDKKTAISIFANVAQQEIEYSRA